MTTTESRWGRGGRRAGGQLIAVLALVAGTLSMLPSASSGETTTFSNPDPIMLYRPGAPPGCPTFPAPNNSCPPTPPTLYPAPITVSGMGGTVTDVNVTLHNLVYRWWDASDLDVMLVAPGGARVMLMSDACGDSANTARFPVTSPMTLTFDDEAPVGLPADTACSGGAYLPTDEDDPDENFPFTGDDVFCGPPDPAAPDRCQPPTGAEASATSTDLNTFNGIDANGTWKLYVVDDTPSDPGTELDGFNGGWSLNITTTTAPTTTPTTTEESTTTTEAPTTTTTTTTTTAPAPSADLSVTVSTPDSTRVGRKVSLSATVKNLGPSTATNVTLVFNVPDAFNITSGTPAACALDAATKTYTCTYASVAKGGKGVSVKVSGSFALGGGHTTAASATAETEDPNTANNSATKTTTVG